MKQMMWMAVIGFLSGGLSVQADETQAAGPIEGVVWGEVVNGLQLGISPPSGKKEGVDMYYGGDQRFDVHLRNVGKSEVRLLASVHRCLAMGSGTAVLVSKLVLKPKDGGEALAVTYQGANHAWLLDPKRSKKATWQETVGTKGADEIDFEIEADSADYLSTVIAPGESAPVSYVGFNAKGGDKSPWCLVGKTDKVPPGEYQVTAILKIDQKHSAWKGTLTTGSLAVNIPDQK